MRLGVFIVVVGVGAEFFKGFFALGLAALINKIYATPKSIIERVSNLIK